MRFAGRDHVGALLNDLTANVFQNVGCGPGVIADVVRGLNDAVTPGATRGEQVDVQFRASGSVCEVIVSVDDTEIWRTSHSIP